MSPHRGHGIVGKPDFDPSDPVQVAVKVTQLESAILGSQREFTRTAESLNDNVEGMREELKAVVKGLGELTRVNGDMHNAQTNQDRGLERAFAAIRELGESTRSRFTDAEEDLEAWKRRYEEERDRWRSAHEEDNRKTREKMILWSGIASGVSLLATTLVLVLLFIYTSDKAAAELDRRRIEQTTAATASRIESEMRAKTDADAKAIREIERYLTQEGTISNRPYTPSR